MVQKNINLADYLIDPIPSNNTADWLDNNSQLHREMNAALGLQSVDLESVNTQNERELQAWVWSHYQEHRSAEQALQI